MIKEKAKVIFLTGPTAVGKSEAAVCLAKMIRAEIVSCDSMQIYKGMDIITSKPPGRLRKRIKHHLIGLVPASRDYDVSRFRRDALKKIRDIIKRGKVPLFVGGTGLYISMLVDGIFEFKVKDKRIRQRLYKVAQSKGSPYLYRKLKKADPQAADKIHPNDLKRLVRALEVFEAAGRPISVLQKERRGLAGDYDVRIICLNMRRDKLYKRINERVERMFKAGLLAEVKRLLKARLSRPASYAIGINEIKGYMESDYGLEEAKLLMKRNSRRYAKRQLTWFRKDKRIKWLNVKWGEKSGTLAKRILKKLS